MTTEIDNEAASPDGEAGVFQLRGHPVMLAAAVAAIFQVQTREIVQIIKENTSLSHPCFPSDMPSRLRKPSWARWQPRTAMGRDAQGCNPAGNDHEKPQSHASGGYFC